ncbi:MAG: cytochrome ubiquinol oxidase subunit I [Actinobacteria bacterium]|nr:cytochrome ubiquinol oxidase subunit I [Actinomycetota bacterium]
MAATEGQAPLRDVILDRIQFGLTASFHFIFPPLSLGVGLMLMIFGIQSVRTKDPKWRQLSMFWVRIYGLIFAMGVATGIVMEFEFGTNWSVYSRYVGNVFGSLLAAEGIFAFMLEGGFLGLMLFGSSRLGNKMWLFATSMVVIGAHFSATWIIMANSWMQTPRGYEITQGPNGPMAVMTNFSEVVFTPSFIPRLLHVIVASWMLGAAMVASVSAWYLLKQRHVEIAKTMMRVSLPIFCVLAVLQVSVFGAQQATVVAKEQPVKLASMEGLWETRDCAPLYLFGWVDTANETTSGVSIPCMLSILVGFTPDTEIQGLNAFPDDEYPNINLVFQVYHAMIDLGMLFVGVSALVAFMAWRRKLFTSKLVLRILVVNVGLVFAAIIAGWWTAEFGRQPWIVWDQLRTADAASPNLSMTTVAISLTGFVIVYSVLLVVFFWLLNQKIQAGPPDPPDAEKIESLPDSFGEIFARKPRASSRVG